MGSELEEEVKETFFVSGQSDSEYCVTNIFGEFHEEDSFGSVDSGVAGWGVETDPETGLEVISLEEVGRHDTREDGWMVIYDKVYDITEFLEEHPGGEDVLMEYLGYDATMAFRGVGHSRAAVKMLEKYLLGILPRVERLNFSS